MNTSEKRFTFNSVILVTRNLERAESFYTRALGLRTVSRIRNENHQLITVQLQGNTLGIVLSQADPNHHTDAPADHGISSVSIVCNVENVDQTVHDFVEAGGALKSGPKQRYWGARTALVEDMDGHRWMFQTITEKRSVSEIRDMIKPWTYETVE